MTMTETEVPPWLKALPLAPEFHPTEAEFLDPIDYIFKIEQEAAQFGICKIVPPFIKASKRIVFNNLNLSLANSQDGPSRTASGSLPPLARTMGPTRSMSGSVPTGVGLEVDAGGKAKFTTRLQQLGWNARKSRAALTQAVVHKLVWQSGESYTLDQFEAKAKLFSRNRLGTSQEVAPLAVEALFWKASLEKAISIEYANDIPGSAFAEPKEVTSSTNHKRRRGLDDGSAAEPVLDSGPGQEEEEKADLDEEMALSGDETELLVGSGVESAIDNAQGIGCKLSNSAWNMRRVARSPGSLLRFIPDEVPGVTSPMVYIGMLFSWFAWHVEDHELHSLNYLHTGAPKTWYAVPGEAAPALEEVVRLHGYGDQLNPRGWIPGCSQQKKFLNESLRAERDAFARLGEKTTVMSPEVLVAAGVPCCRLVQNAGEYVVTFPRAYHLGFSHGFNCGEAANFATPGWLDVAREASVRRAAMNYLPMLSHQQLLYMLAMSLTSRALFDSACEKRSSRLKEKKRVGEEMVKSVFINDVIQQNDLIGKLLDNGVASCLMMRDTNTPPHELITTKDSFPPESMNREQGTISTLEAASQQGGLSKGNVLESPCSETPIEMQIPLNLVPASLASEDFSLDHRDKEDACKVSGNTSTLAEEALSKYDPVTSMLPLDWGVLPCAACGILCYSGMAVVEPSETTATKLKPLQSHVSGAGSHRAKGLDSSSTGVLPGKADKKSADFHMLPSAGVVPLLELEDTTPDYAEASYEDQTGEPEVCTPDLKEECPSTKDCSHEVMLDAEMPHDGLASTISERDEVLSSEDVKAGDSAEVDNVKHDVVKGLWSSVSVGLIERLPNAVARSTNCGPETSEAQQHGNASFVGSDPSDIGEEGTLSSLQLLAFAYDDDSDAEDDDDNDDANEKEQEKGVPVDIVTAMGSPLVGSRKHTDDIGFCVGVPLNPKAQSSPSSELNATDVNSKQEETPTLPTLDVAISNNPTSVMVEVDLLQQTDSMSFSYGCSKEGAGMCVVVPARSEECLDPATQLDSCDTSPRALTSSNRFAIGLSACKPGRRDDTLRIDLGGQQSNILSSLETDIVPGDKSNQRPVLPFGECVTCSMPHDSFFDSFEELTPKKTDDEVMELENCMEETGVPVSCHKDSNLLSITAPQVVEARGHSTEGSSVISDVGFTKSGEAVDKCGIDYPTASANEELSGKLESNQLDSIVPKQYKGAARPRVLCLEHAVVAQQMLDSIGGARVIIVCHSSFPNIEQQAKEVAAEVGSEHQWRSVPFKKAGDEEYSIINAAIEAEEENMPGDNDWIEQLNLSVHGHDKVGFNNSDIFDVNPFGEEIEEVRSGAGRRGRKSREKKSSIIGQWCGKGWRSDQVHPLLGGCRYLAALADNTILPTFGAAGGISSLSEGGRSRKVMRPAHLAEYTPDGRTPKADIDIKKSGRKRKMLLDPAVDDSEDEIDEDNIAVTPPSMCGSENVSLAQATVYGSSEDSLWRDVPIASTDSFLLPLHLSGVVAKRGPDQFGRTGTLAFTPESIFSTGQEMPHTATACPDGTFQSEAGQCCSVVGGFLQRGAKLQALQKLCRQLSTPVSVPSSPLTTPVRFASRVKPSQTKISTAKLVNRLKRKPTTESILDVKKRKFLEENERGGDDLAVQKDCSSGLQNDVPEFVNNVFKAENAGISKSDRGEENKELRPGNDSSCEIGGGVKSVLRLGNDTPAENNGAEDVNRGLDADREQHSTDSRPVQGDSSNLSEESELSLRKNNQGVSTESLSKTPQQPSHMLPPQTPNRDSSSALIFCTESLSQVPSIDEAKQEPWPSVTEASPLLTEPILVTKVSRVRGKRMKSREWKSCIQISATLHDNETLEEDNKSGVGINDLVTLEPNVTTEGCSLEVQADPDFFPYSSCLTSSTTSVRRRRVSTPGMVEWGTSRKGKDEGEGAAELHPVVQDDAKNKKRKKGVKNSSQKRSQELEGEFQCDMDGCIMAFDTVRDLQLHKRNLCTWKGCGKHFHMHKYLLQHRRVHLDDRPLKCPWKGCTQAFKWAWARTEHIRVHTGERPYKCMVSGCGQTFRFVSDFSRHKRNTGHRPT